MHPHDGGVLVEFDDDAVDAVQVARARVMALELLTGSGRSAMPSIGVAFSPRAPDALLPFVERVEALGFGEVWIVETPQCSGSFGAVADALAATDHMAIGLGRSLPALTIR